LASDHSRAPASAFSRTPSPAFRQTPPDPGHPGKSVPGDRPGPPANWWRFDLTANHANEALADLRTSHFEWPAVLVP
jgi:hypothetical protein